MGRSCSELAQVSKIRPIFGASRASICCPLKLAGRFCMGLSSALELEDKVFPASSPMA